MVRSFPSPISVGLLACLPVLIVPAALATPSGPPRPGADRLSTDRQVGATPLAESLRAASGRDIPQTSDGVRGPVARPRFVPERGADDASVRRYWQVAPGVTATVWDERDARGPIRAHLLTIDYEQAGLSIDYANDGRVNRTAPLSTILRPRRRHRRRQR